MGCGMSKMDDSPLVSLCRGRKESVKAAADCRYALASAHILYFQSLLDVGNALNRFVVEEVVISVDSPLDFVSDHQSSGEDSHLELSASDSDSDSDSDDLDSLSDDNPGDDSSEGPEVHEHSFLNNQSRQGVNSNVYYMRRSSVEIPSRIYEQPRVMPVTSQWNEMPKPLPRYPQYGNGVSFAGPVNFPPNDLRFPQYGNQASFAGPVNFPPNDLRFPDGNGASFGRPMVFPPNDIRFPQYGNGVAYSVQMDLPPRDPYFNQTQSAPAAPPPPPPPPQDSTWDYVNPFNLVDDIYANYYSQDRYGTGPSTGGPHLREVREREGIPDLEDETEKNLVKEVSKKIELNEEEERSVDSSGGSSEVEPLKNDEDAQLAQENETKSSDDDIVDQEKEIKSGPDTIEKETKSGPCIPVSESLTEDTRNNGGTVEVEEALTQEDETLRPFSLTTLATHGPRDLPEVVKEIRDAFETAFSYGKEVSLMLEAGKLPYLPRDTVLKVLPSRILGLVAPSMVASSLPAYTMSKRLVLRTMKMAKANNGNLEKEDSMKSGNLSSTLDKLYAWEKKLYEEVKALEICPVCNAIAVGMKDEEKLRVIYDKECKKLKDLDDRGAEFSKIDATRASIRRLLPKINVAVRAVDTISRRIHKLRDEELQPQLNGLINGLIRMWQFMVKCHQKQFQAIMESKTRVRIANAGIRRDSSLRATLELEKEILNWGTLFNDWISTQKAFVKFLNEWLLGCLFQEPEETPDGIVPFSPSRIGAPPIFIVCNDWYHAIEKISETRVLKAINDFAASLHQLWEKQDEEQRQRLKTEYLSKDFQKRLKSVRMESGVNRNQDASTNTAAASGGPIDSEVPLLDGLTGDLDVMKKRLDEENARHEGAIKQVNDAASDSLRGSLIPIFEALENFCSETLKAYEQVRIPNGVGSAQ